MAEIKQIIDGLKILVKYPGGDNIAAEHDIIYAGPTETITEYAEEDGDGDDAVGSVVSAKDAAELKALGWFIDSEVECWARFV